MNEPKIITSSLTALEQLEKFLLPPAFEIGAPLGNYINDYFGILCVFEPSLRAAVERFNGVNLHAHFNSAEAQQRVAENNSRAFAATDDGIAVFRVNGMMMKSVPSAVNGTSTVRLRQQLNDARRDPNIRGGLLVMDTPGGTVKGNADAVDAAARFAATKPLYQFTEDMTASAGVSLASQANKRYANVATAAYGAMGTYSVLEDHSGRADKLGVVVHVISEGDFKGMGTLGTKITEAHIQEVARLTKAFNESYLGSIAKGTGKSLEMIRSLADGRVILASDAVSAGLIDGVQTLEETYAQLVAAVKPKATSVLIPSRSATAMEPATLAELKKTFPKSTAEWRETQLEANATLSTAAINYASFVEEQATKREEAHKQELAEAKAAIGKPAINKHGARKPTSLGHDPLLVEGAADYQGASGDPIEDFNAAVAKLAGPSPTRGKRWAAVRTVAARDTQLYQAYLLAQNPGKRQQRVLMEKMESMAGSADNN